MFVGLLFINYINYDLKHCLNEEDTETPRAVLRRKFKWSRYWQTIFYLDMFSAHYAERKERVRRKINDIKALKVCAAERDLEFIIQKV